MAYCWDREEDDGLVDLRVVGLDGSEPRILYSTNEQTRWVEPCAWFPDGKRILAHLTGKDGTDQIVQFSVTDGSFRVLKTVGKDCLARVELSPDGRYILYDLVRQEDGGPLHRDIWLTSIDGNRETPLVEHPADDSVIGWAPDGKNILFTSSRSGTLAIWLVAVADGKPRGKPRMIKPVVGGFEPFGFTKKGSFYYGISRNIDDIYVATLDPKTGKILGPPKKEIGLHEGSNFACSYSPDGKYLAHIYRSGVLTGGGSGNILCVRSLETGKEREFPFNGDALRWTSERKGLAVVVNNLPSVISVDSGETRQIAELKKLNLEGISDLCWSHEGKALFYYIRHDAEAKTVRVLARDLETGTEQVLYRSPDSAYAPFRIALSPDGKWLALRCIHPTSLKIIPATGGEARELPEFEKAASSKKSIAWTADGRYLLFSAKRSRDESELCRISAESGEIEKLGLKMDGCSSLSAHPDGRCIVFGTGRNVGEVWAMENFLPQTPVADPANQPNFRKISIPTKPGNGVLSPDGKKLAFVSRRSIWVVPVHGKVSPDIAGEPVRLTGTKGAWRYGMSWSADGKWIAYNTLPSEDHVGICIVPSSGGTVKRIVNRYRAGVSIHNYLLSLSPDGKRVAFTSDEKEEIQLFTVNVEGPDVNQLTLDGGTQPAFSPDGKKIAYVKEEPQTKDIRKSDVWVIPAAGGTPVQVSDLPGKATGPIWSPDGKTIAFTRKANPGSDFSKEICIVPVSETGKPEASPTQIELPHRTREFLAGWTPDNKIGVHLMNPLQFAIYTVPASGGNATQVTPQGFYFSPRWSPDGKRIYFRGTDGPEGIASVPSEGGEISISPIDADSRGSQPLQWGGNVVSPDGRKIVFPASKKDNESRSTYIYTIPVEGGEPKQLTIIPGYSIL